MKWILLSPLVILLTACNCCTNTAVEYRRVTYTPAIMTKTVVTRPAVVRSPVVVTTPVYYSPVTIIDTDPIDVTTTTIDYY
ncbi:hypothetical protein [Legionella fairfieldensis]|uniref:hypothetical protein n=1 Tax=Legionella fairfieldensis TaxID=45064 RepID=UPI00049033A4|nr:hypothetical protein [Legionella fairfieldensis]